MNEGQSGHRADALGASPRAVYVMADLPAPPRGGNDLRYLQNLHVLVTLGYETRVVSGVARADRDTAGVGRDAALECAVPIAAASTTAAARLRRFGALLRAGVAAPIDPWATVYRDAGFDVAVVQAVRRLRPDVVVVRSLFAHLISDLRPHTDHVVVDLHDVAALQAEAMATAVHGAARVPARLRVRAARRVEPILSEADEIWGVSEAELDYLRGARVTAPLLLVRNGIPVPRFLPGRRPPSRDLLLIAGYGYPPNLSAARRLVERVLPRVRAVVPETEVTIVGRHLPASLAQEWSQRDGVTVAGVVDDTAAYLDRAAAVVFLPAWGTGTPLKVAEALAAGVPLVANRAAVAGFGDLEAGRHYLCAESDADAAAHVVSLLTDSELVNRLAADGWEYARTSLSREAVVRAIASASVLRR